MSNAPGHSRKDGKGWQTTPPAVVKHVVGPQGYPEKGAPHAYCGGCFAKDCASHSRIGSATLAVGSPEFTQVPQPASRLQERSAISNRMVDPWGFAPAGAGGTTRDHSTRLQIA